MLGHGGRGTPLSRGASASAPETYTSSDVHAALAARQLRPSEFFRLALARGWESINGLNDRRRTFGRTREVNAGGTAWRSGPSIRPMAGRCSFRTQAPVAGPAREVRCRTDRLTRAFGLMRSDGMATEAPLLPAHGLPTVRRNGSRRSNYVKLQRVAWNCCGYEWVGVASPASSNHEGGEATPNAKRTREGPPA
jgi:hypothetical protein